MAPIPSDGRSLGCSHGRGFEHNPARETQLASGTTMLKFVRDAGPVWPVKSFQLDENAVSSDTKVAPPDTRDQIR